MNIRYDYEKSEISLILFDVDEIEYTIEECENYATLYCNSESSFPLECLSLVELECEIDSNLQKEIINRGFYYICKYPNISDDFKEKWC